LLSIACPHLPTGLAMYTQVIFGSIGYATGSAVGASIAAKEADPSRKRLVLVTGDGSLQLTVQAFSILVRAGLTPTIFVINNSGYTIERLIHGLHADYNDIPDWDYTALLKAFAPKVESKSYRVSKSADLDALLNDREFNNAGYAQLVEVIMDPFDAPSAMVRLGQAIDSKNAG